jgi:hypothetical protein
LKKCIINGELQERRIAMRKIQTMKTRLWPQLSTKTPKRRQSMSIQIRTRHAITVRKRAIPKKMLEETSVDS